MRRPSAASRDFIAREVRVEVADPLSGVGIVEVRLAGDVLETRLAADGRTAVARVPDGVALTARRSQYAPPTSSPANTSELGVTPPVRPLPVIRGLSVSNAGVTGRVVAAQTGTRVQVWAYPKGRAPRLLGAYPTRADGRFSVRVMPRRTTRYAVAVPEGQLARGLSERVAGTVRVTARVTGLRCASAAAVWRCAHASTGGEATRLHLLVHDVRGGRWVEACLEHGRPGVRLERTGRVWGACRIPPSARGRAWTYRLVLAAPSSTWPWKTPSSASSSVLLPL